MKIYISHSRSFNYLQELYEPIKSSKLFEKNTIIFPHETSHETYPIRDMLVQKEIDLVIAEVSHASTGQGIELGWANGLHVPILCLYKDGAVPSDSLHTVTTKLLMYTSHDNMIEDIIGALKLYE